MNKNLTALLLACSVGVGTYLLAGSSAAQETPPTTETTETSVFVCAPIPQDPGCEQWDDYYTTETSIFVCSPYPDPSCEDEEVMEDEDLTEEDLQEPAPPALPILTRSVSYTG